MAKIDLGQYLEVLNEPEDRETAANREYQERLFLEYLVRDGSFPEERKRIQNKLHKVWADKVAREQDIARLRRELEEERRSFPLLRFLSSLRRRGLKQTFGAVTAKIRRKLGK